MRFVAFYMRRERGFFKIQYNVDDMEGNSVYQMLKLLENVGS